MVMKFSFTGVEKKIYTCLLYQYIHKHMLMSTNIYIYKNELHYYQLSTIYLKPE
jgi:hypothetical protein